jgi:peptide/nickel transport system substrate-binding protein
MDWCIQNGDWDGTEESYEALNNPVPGGSPINSIACGTGPFMLEHWKSGIEISLVRNDNYWGAPASFERVLTRVIPDWNQRGSLLYSGDVDAAAVPIAETREVAETPGVRVY